jgi:hypothetical protein
MPYSPTNPICGLMVRRASSTPVRIQAWREENELADRDLMREGRWLV